MTPKFHKFLLPLILPCSAAMVACGGGGGAGGGSGPTTDPNDFAVRLSAFELPPARARALAQVDPGKSTGTTGGLNFKATDSAITDVTVEGSQSGANWEFRLVRTTTSDTLTATVPVQPQEGGVGFEIWDSAPDSTNPLEARSRVYFQALKTGASDWLYAAYWLHKPAGDPSTVELEIIGLTGSSSPYPQADIGGLSGKARFGGIGGGDDDAPEVFGYYSTADDDEGWFDASLLLEADFDTNMIKGVIDLGDLGTGVEELHLLETTIAATEPGGSFEGTTDGKGGDIDDWTGKWNGKFHFKLSELNADARRLIGITGAVPTEDEDLPFVVLGTFDASNPGDTQSILGLIIARINSCSYAATAACPNNFPTPPTP